MLFAIAFLVYYYGNEISPNGKPFHSQVILCHSNPGSHPFISGTEKQYLEKELGHVESDATKLCTPWKLMLTSAPVLALIFTQAAHDWGFFVIATDLPKYMNDVLHVSVQDNGIFSSIPHFVELIMSFFIGYLSDWLIEHRYVSVTHSRKLFVILGKRGIEKFAEA